MKIYTGSFTLKHKVKALKRILKAFIFGIITWSELTRTYLAMLHLERYLEHLNSNKSKKALLS